MWVRGSVMLSVEAVAMLTAKGGCVLAEGETTAERQMLIAIGAPAAFDKFGVR
jgi:hypothetical protein